MKKYNWRYYRIFSYISFALGFYKGLNGDNEAFYEFMVFGFFLELKDDLHQIEEKIKSE